LKFDPSLNKYDNFSKKHHREKLFKLLNDIDWENEYKIKIYKQEANPYEEVFEDFFEKRSSYKLANINFLFKFNLFNMDFRLGYTPIMIVGDDGGFADYIMWNANRNDFTVRLFVIAEKSNKISKTKFRKEIEETKDDTMSVVELKKGYDLDEVEDLDEEKIQNLIENILENSNDMGLSLYICKKNIMFKKESNLEIKLKKFLLLNLIIGLSTLSKGGNMIIKIYDMYTQFTVSILFILFNNFEKFTIIKPFSTRPHSSSRYVVCQKLIEFKPKIVDYLMEIYKKYEEIVKFDRDLDFIIPINKIIKDESFTNYIMEMNSLITEQRIESLEAIKNAFDNVRMPKFDKMDIKKKCLDSWKIPVLHYDPKLLVVNKSKPERQQEKIKKINSINDKDLIKMYSNYDTYSDSMKSMINLIGQKKPTSHHDHHEELQNKKEIKPVQKNNVEKVVPNKKKTSSSSQFEELKQKIFADRKTEEFLKLNHSYLKSNEESHDDLLKKKRENLMSGTSANFLAENKKSAKIEKSEKSEKINTPKSNKIKVPLSIDIKEEIQAPRELVKKKEQAVQESIKNREIAETKKLILDDSLKSRLEKYKSKNS
jgi:hypothetical protein